MLKPYKGNSSCECVFPCLTHFLFCSDGREAPGDGQVPKVASLGFGGGCGVGYWVPWITRPLHLPGKTPPDLLAVGADAWTFAALRNLLACVLTSAVSGSLRPKVHAPDCVIGWHLSPRTVGLHPGPPSPAHTSVAGGDWETCQPEVRYPPQNRDNRLPALWQLRLASQSRRE